MRVIIEEDGEGDYIRVEELHPDFSLILTPDAAAELAEKLTDALQMLKNPKTTFHVAHWKQSHANSEDRITELVAMLDECFDWARTWASGTEPNVRNRMEWEDFATRLQANLQWERIEPPTVPDD